MNFGEALTLLKTGNKVCRVGWNGQNMHIFLIKDWSYSQQWNEHSFVAPFIAMRTSNKNSNAIIPWLASHADMLAEDWEIVKE